MWFLYFPAFKKSMEEKINDGELVYTYLDRTAQSLEELMEGVVFFQRKGIIEMVSEANKLDKRIIYYYKNEEDKKNNTLSFRFVWKRGVQWRTLF